MRGKRVGQSLEGMPAKPQVRDDMDEELLPVFLEEADELCPKIGSLLRVWYENPEDKQQSNLLKRSLHTLKGSARMAGAMRIGEIVHEMEDRVLVAAQMRDQAGYWDGLESDFHRIGELLEELRGGKNQEGQPELSGSAAQMRMVPFASISERLYRVVRQTCKELDKRANLELSDDGVELDRVVLEKMTAPFEHLLRNAIAHGLESEQLRLQSGKEPIGEIRLTLRQGGNEVIFEFADDGFGLNLAALREKATDQGLLQPGETVNEEHLTQLIFMPGISTATEVTKVAGRGIGMDVVRSEIVALGGRIAVSSKSGKGTQFTIHLPVR